MIVVLAAVLVLSTAGFLFTLDRQNTRHARQVLDLCQRLQAPEMAAVQYAVQTPTEPQYLPFDNDEAFMKYADG